MRTLALSCSTLVAVGILGTSGPARAETIYVTNEKGNTVTVIDGQTLEVVKTIPVGERPRGFVMSLDYKTLYICASDSGEIEAAGSTGLLFGVMQSHPAFFRFISSRASTIATISSTTALR